MSVTYREVLGVTDFRRLMGAYVVNSVGTWAYVVVLTVYLYDRTGSPAVVTAFLCASMVPRFLAAPYGGVLADRYERTKVMRVSALGAFVTSSAMAVQVFLDGPLPLLALTVALTAVTTVAYGPASQALLPDLVDERRLATANAFFLTVENVVLVVGPALGGLLLVVADPGWSVVANALSFLAAALLLGRLRTRSRVAEVRDRRSVRAQVAEGVRALSAEPVALRLVVYFLIASAVTGSTNVLFVAASDDLLGTGAEGFGYLLTAYSVGGVASAVLTNRLSELPLARVVVLGLALESLPLAAMALVDAPWAAAGLMVVSGAASVVLDVVVITALQRQVRRDALGRVFGLLDTALYAANIGASVLASVLILTVGTGPALAVVGLAGAVVSVLLVRPLLAADRETAAERRRLAPVAEALAALDLFADATVGGLQQLARAVEVEEVRAGTVVLTEGEPAQALYVLHSGRAGVTSAGESGVPRELASMDAGTVFGEIGLLRHSPRTATVTATTDCVLWRVPAEDFFAAVEVTPVSRGLLDLLDGRLALTHPRLAASTPPAPEGGPPA